MKFKTAIAVQMDRYGPPEVLVAREIARQRLGPRVVRIQTLAAAVNHTDLEIRAGHWPVRQAKPFPYTPGVEVVGVIVETGADVAGFGLGQTVITMMQGLGGVLAERPGGYASEVVVDAEAVAILPEGSDALAMAALGLGAVTAYEGLIRLGGVAGKRILVTGAAGGVGSAACAIATAMGAHVTGLVRRDEQAAHVRAMGAEEVVIARPGLAPSLLARTFDGVIDTVGGALFAACTEALADGGALCLVGAVAGGAVAFDAWNLIRPVTLTGYSSEALTGPSLRMAMEALVGWSASGVLTPPRYQILPLHDAAEAHRRLERGGVQGRILLCPTSTDV
jgi:NADPH2:quinone reductase